MTNYLDNSKSKLDLFRQKLYIIIYGVNTPAGKAFDVGHFNLNAVVYL